MSQCSPGPFIHADVCDLNQLHSIVEQHNIDWVVHFAALLSAIGEQDVKKAKQVTWQLFILVKKAFCKNMVT